MPPYPLSNSKSPSTLIVCLVLSQGIKCFWGIAGQAVFLHRWYSPFGIGRDDGRKGPSYKFKDWRLLWNRHTLGGKEDFGATIDDTSIIERDRKAVPCWEDAELNPGRLASKFYSC